MLCNSLVFIIIFTCLIYRSSEGAKGDSESEIDPFVQPKTSIYIRY